MENQPNWVLKIVGWIDLLLKKLNEWNIPLISIDILKIIGNFFCLKYPFSFLHSSNRGLIIAWEWAQMTVLPTDMKTIKKVYNKQVRYLRLISSTININQFLPTSYPSPCPPIPHIRKGLLDSNLQCLIFRYRWSCRLYFGGKSGLVWAWQTGLEVVVGAGHWTGIPPAPPPALQEKRH